MKYVYPCVLEYEEGVGYGVYFPDVDGVFTSGRTLYEALKMAEDALLGMLISMEDDGDKILPPTDMDKVKPTPVKYASKVLVTLIKADTDAYRETLEKIQKKESVQESEAGAA